MESSKITTMLLLSLTLAVATQSYMTIMDKAHAEAENVYTVEGGVEIRISYPDSMIAGRDGTVSILVKNNGWEDKQNISFMISPPDVKSITTEPSGMLEIGKLAEEGSHGQSINLHAVDGANPGTYYLNLRYTHVLVANNESPQDPFFYDIAVPIIIREDAGIVIRTQTPESIFAGAEFPITVVVSSEYVDIKNVQVRIIPPQDIEFRGETQHVFSKIEKGMPVSITSRIVTQTEQVTTEYMIPFHIIVEYADDLDKEKTDSQTVSVVLRPRTFMELTMDGGIWIGGVFLAPYVSIGTIVGIPAGAIISLLLKKKFGGQTRTRKSKDTSD